MPVKRLTFGSLFTGIQTGGFDLGFEDAGMECRWQVEIDKDCQRVLERHWPGVERFSDITTVSGLPAVDVLCGGFPCQDLSVAGRRAGLAGERSGLFYAFVRVIADVRPTWVVIENVVGLLSSNGGRDMGAVLGTLGELGYGYAYRVLDAQYFGVAQRRNRVFIVGHARAECAAQVLFEPESCAGNPPPRREAGERVAPTLEGRAGMSGENGFNTSGGLVAHTLKVNDKGHSGNTWNSNYVAATLRSRQHAEGVNPPGRGGEDDQNLVVAGADGTRYRAQADHDTLVTGLHLTQDPITPAECSPALSGNASVGVAHTLRAAGCDASEDGTGRGTPLVVTGVSANQRGEVRQRAVHGSLNGSHSGKQYDGVMVTAFHEDQRTGAVYENDHTHALSSGGGGKPGQGYQAVRIDSSVRRLTPVECSRLQAFPDDWLDGLGLSDSAKYRMLGNAVVVNVAEWIGRRIVEASA